MRIRCIAPSLSLCVAPALHAQAKIPGWTYAINVTYDSGAGPSERGSIAIRYRTTANAMRQEMLQVGGTANRIANGFDIENSYTLVNDSDGTFTTVMPGERSAMVMANPMSMFADHPKPTVSANTTTQSFEDLGAGEKILGHATHHYRMTTTGTTTIKIGDEVCTRPADAESELWVAPDVDILPAMRSMLAHYSGLLPDSEMAKRSPSAPAVQGVPLRTKTRTTAVTPSGEKRVIETTVEYVELSNAPLDASLFTVPSDFRVTDMRKQMAGILAQAGASGVMDSTMQAALCPH